ncbi:MAG: phage major capsid protein [Candidatus Thiodiazotropha sp. (ex Codakia rugifera)]|nr:phage major capsid protein [Candidatus Thiodiazotropha sp. (ex Codakia rugifera)]
MTEVLSLIEEQGRAFDEFKGGIDSRFTAMQDELANLKRPTASSEAPAATNSEPIAWGHTTDGKRVPFLSKEQKMVDFVYKDNNQPFTEFEGSGDPNVANYFEGDFNRLSAGAFLRASVLGPRNEIERKVLAESGGPTGGYTVPEILSARVIDRLRAKSVLSQAGAITVPLETQRTVIARLDSDPTPVWRGENEQVSESEPTFGAIAFDTRSLAVLVKVSRELLEDSLNIEEALMGALSSSLALELDRVGMFGNGADEPLGITQANGIGSVSMGTNGAAITDWSSVLDLLLEIEQDNAGPTTAIIQAPRTWRTIEGFVDSTGQPLQPPPAIAAIPRLTTTSVPIDQTMGSATNASSMIAGNFSQVMIGLRTGIRIEVLKEAYADHLQYAFLAHLRADIALAHRESFAELSGIVPA